MKDKGLIVTNFKGTQDILGLELRKRREVGEVIRGVFERHGFLELETPCIEYLDILLGKYGEEGEKLIYKLDYEGRECGLRYDLTVPLWRVIQQHGQNWIYPFKRYQMGKVWRGERAQLNQGRYREFYQCDVDIVGTDGFLGEVEMMEIIVEVMEGLGVRDYKIKLNHRSLLKAWVKYFGLSEGEGLFLFRELDKVDKIGEGGVMRNLEVGGFSEGKVREIFEKLGGWEGMKEELRVLEEGREGLGELEGLLEYLEGLGLEGGVINFEPRLVRGLDYYTGLIYEVVSTSRGNIGSLVGGGRYDNLMEVGGKKLGCIGLTVGLDRILALLDQERKGGGRGGGGGGLMGLEEFFEVLVVVFEGGLKEALRVGQELRRGGLRTEVYYREDRLKKQLRYGLKKGARFIVMAGETELKEEKVKVKDLKRDFQEDVLRKNLVDYIQNKKN